MGALDTNASACCGPSSGCPPPAPPPPPPTNTPTTAEPVKRLRRVQDAPLEGKVVLVRVDHHCVKGINAMTDAFRVDATIATLYNIVERGGRPILMAGDAISDTPGVMQQPWRAYARRHPLTTPGNTAM
jgi:hypothetical protein